MKTSYFCLIFYCVFHLNFIYASASSPYDLDTINRLMEKPLDNIDELSEGSQFDDIDKLLEDKLIDCNEIESLLEQLPDPENQPSTSTHDIEFHHPNSIKLSPKEFEKRINKQKVYQEWDILHDFQLNPNTANYWSEVCLILWDKPWVLAAGTHSKCFRKKHVATSNWIQTVYGWRAHLEADILGCECRLRPNKVYPPETFYATPAGDKEYFIFVKKYKARTNLRVIAYLREIILPSPLTLISDIKRWAELIYYYPLHSYKMYWASICSILWDKPRPNQTEKNPVCTAYANPRCKISTNQADITRTADCLMCECHLRPQLPGPSTDYETFYATLNNRNEEYFILQRHAGILKVIDYLTGVSIPRPYDDGD